jgi:hypothetical protein
MSGRDAANAKFDSSDAPAWAVTSGPGSDPRPLHQVAPTRPGHGVPGGDPQWNRTDGTGKTQRQAS